MSIQEYFDKNIKKNLWTAVAIIFLIAAGIFIMLWGAVVLDGCPGRVGC